MEIPVITEGPASAVTQVAPTIVGVRFMPVGKIYHFDAAHVPDVRVADWVVVTTSRRKQMGQVASLHPPRHQETDGPFKPIERLATNRDLALKKYWRLRRSAPW